MEQAARWPVWDCWASENWHEQGAHVYCCFARRHDDGQVAAAFFELDLSDKGVVEVATKAPITQGEVHAELAKVAGEELAMLSVDPMLVVKLVDTARDFGEKQGHRQPSNLGKARKIFGGIRGSKAREEIRVGTPDPNAPPPKKASGGWLDGVKGMLGLG